MTDQELIQKVRKLGVKRVHLIERNDNVGFYQCAINMYAHKVRIHTDNQFHPVKSYEMYDILKHMDDIIIEEDLYEDELTVRGMLEYILDGGRVVGFFEEFPFK